MRPRSLLVLALVVLALGAFLWFVERDLPGSEERAGRARLLLPGLDPEAVTAVVLDRPGEPRLRLERSGGPGSGTGSVEAGTAGPGSGTGGGEVEVGDPDRGADDEAGAPGATVGGPSAARNGGRSPAAGDGEGSGPAGWRVAAPPPLAGARADRQRVETLLSALAGLVWERELEDPDRVAVGLAEPRLRLLLETAAGGDGGGDGDGGDVGGVELVVGGEVPASRSVLVAVDGAGRQGVYALDRAFLADLDRPAGDWRDRDLLPVTRSDLARVTLLPPEGGAVEEGAAVPAGVAGSGPVADPAAGAEVVATPVPESAAGAASSAATAGATAGAGTASPRASLPAGVPPAGAVVLEPRPDGGFDLVAPFRGPADPPAVDELVAALVGLRAEAFVDDAGTPSLEVLGLAPPRGTVVVETVAGASHRVEVGAPAGAAEAGGDFRDEPGDGAGDGADGGGPWDPVGAGVPEGLYLRVDGRVVVAAAPLLAAVERPAGDWASRQLTHRRVFEVERLAVHAGGAPSGVAAPASGGEGAEAAPGPAAGPGDDPRLRLERRGADWLRETAAGAETIPYTAVTDLLYALTESRAERTFPAAAVRLPAPELTFVLAGGGAAAGGSRPAGEETAAGEADPATGWRETISLHPRDPEGSVPVTVSGRQRVLVLPPTAAAELRAAVEAVRDAGPLPEEGGGG